MVFLVLLKQEWWGLPIAGYLFLGGMGGMMSIAATYWWIRHRNKVVAFFGSFTAFLVMIAGIALLVMDLTKPFSAYLIYLTPRPNYGSWVTIGTYIISFYTLSLLVFAAQFLPGARRLPWQRLKVVLDKLILVSAALGVATATYTGFLLSSAPGVAIWNTPLLPLLFIVSGLSTGMCMYCLFLGPIAYITSGGRVGEDEARIRIWMQSIDVVALAIELLLVFLFLLSGFWSGNPSALESVKTLLYGSLSPIFWIAVVLLGNIIPLTLMVAYTLRTREENARIIAVSAIVAALVLAGGFSLRYVILEAGYVAVPLG